jgi:hypothetical protein
MTSTATSAQGTTFSIDTSINETPSYTAIANIRTFSAFDGVNSEIDVTNLSSVAKEFRIGLKDNGKFSMELDRDLSDTGQVALLAAQEAMTEKLFQLDVPTIGTASFAGYVQKFTLGGAVDQVMKSSVDIRISGAVVWDLDT